MKKPSLFKKIFDVLSPSERKHAVFLLLLMIVMAFMEIVGVASIMPFLAVAADTSLIEKHETLKFFFNYFSFSSVSDFVLTLGVAFLVVFYVSTAVRAIATNMMCRFAHNRNNTIGLRLLELFLKQPYVFFLNRNTADLAKTIMTEVNYATSRVMKSSLMFISHSLVCLALIGFMFAVDPWMASVTGAVLGLSYLFVYLLSRKKLLGLGKKLQSSNKGRFIVASEAFGGIKDIKMLGRENDYIDRFRTPSVLYAHTSISEEFISTLPRYVMEALAFTAIMLVALYLIHTKGSLAGTLSILGAYAVAGYRIMPSLQAVFSSLVSIRFGMPMLNSLHKEFSELKNDVQNIAPTNAIISPSKTISFEKISYTYPNSKKPSLSDVSVSFSVGSSLGIVGTTGAGKTTFIDIILGLLIPQMGQLKVDETTITTQNLRSWQNILGYVPQHIYLADDTVAANIAFGLPKDKIDTNKIQRAAKTAMLHDFVTQLPKGYETNVGERGVRLSGGQRQRIGIARALYHDPKILVFDEATSALDNLTEQEVMDAVDKLTGRLTVILVAHRLSTVKNCSKILLLENGRLTNEGTFEELLTSDKAFKAMVNGG